MPICPLPQASAWYPALVPLPLMVYSRNVFQFYCAPARAAKAAAFCRLIALNTRKDIITIQPPNTKTGSHNPNRPSQAKGPDLKKGIRPAGKNIAATQQLKNPAQRGNTGSSDSSEKVAMPMARALLPGFNPRNEADPQWMMDWIKGYAKLPKGALIPLVDTSNPEMPVPF